MNLKTLKDLEQELADLWLVLLAVMFIWALFHLYLLH
jgi:hypothetical protein